MSDDHKTTRFCVKTLSILTHIRDVITAVNTCYQISVKLLLHSVKSLPDTTPYDKKCQNMT